MYGQFAQLEELTEREMIDASTRVFEGDGTPFLSVESLKDVRAIRIRNQELPLVEPREYPINAQLQTTVVEEPLIKLTQKADGTPVLIRSNLSNDGIWPKDTKIFVTGEWNDESNGVRDGASNGSSNGKVAETASNEVVLNGAQNDAIVRDKVTAETGRDASVLEGISPVLVDNPLTGEPLAPDALAPAAAEIVPLREVVASDATPTETRPVEATSDAPRRRR